MSLLDFFLRPRKENTAKVAKERLQIIVAHERSTRGGPDYLPQLKQDLLDVIRKYVAISPDQVTVQLDKKDDLSVLELNIMLNGDKKPGEENDADANAPAGENSAP
ncbi:MAG: cell division topological specificity factor MinE [Aeromonadaceae bacterium]